MKLKNIILTTGLAVLTTAPLQAQDYSQEKRDLNIMRGIFQSVMQEDMSEPTNLPHIETLFLAEQGMVFTVNLPRSVGNYVFMSDYDVSAVPATSAVVVEADSMEYSVGNSGTDEQIESIIRQNYIINAQTRAEIDMQRAQARSDMLEIQERVQELQSRMRQQQRNLEGTADTLRETEQELQGVMEELEARRSNVQRLTEESRAIQAEARLRQREMIVDSMTTTLCDYGSTLRSLEADQFVTLLFQNYEGDSSRVMMFEGREISSCNDVDALLDKATIYDI